MRSLVLAFALAVPAVILAQTVNHPLEVGGEVKPPIAMQTPAPNVPQAVIDERPGCPVVELIVDEQGRTRDLHLIRSSGSSGFDEAILKAMADYRFKPATRRGTPVAVKVSMQTCVHY